MQLKWKRPHTENAAEPKAATNREWLKRKKPHTENAAEREEATHRECSDN
jgi:hypothetical protein